MDCLTVYHDKQLRNSDFMHQIYFICFKRLSK